MWRARPSYCLLAESLCCVRESDSVLLLQAEFWRPVWSEPGSDTQAEPSGCTVLKVAVYILLRILLSLEEESGGSPRAAEGSSEVPAGDQ